MNFDPIAPIYDRLAKGIFGSSIQAIQTDLLPHIPPQSEILMLGGGSGWIIAPLASICRYKKLVFIEDSQKMLSLAHAKLSNSFLSLDLHERTWLLFGRETFLFAPQQFSVLITPFFLDLFSEDDLASVWQAIEPHLSSECLWLVVDFAQGSSHRNPFFSLAIRGMYLFFRWTCGLKNQQLPNIPSFLENNGFVLEKEAHRWAGFMRAQLFRKACHS